MKNTYFGIYGTLTLLIAIIVFVFQPTQRNLFKEAINVLEQFPSFSQEVVANLRSEMEKDIEAYPQYHEYLYYAKQSDTIFQQTNQTFNDTLLDYVQQTISSNNVKDYQISDLDKFIYFNPQQKELYQALREQLIWQKYLAVNNFFRERTQGTDSGCSWGPELIFAPNRIIRPYETVKIKMGLSESIYLSGRMQIAVNGQFIPVKDAKATYKQQTTKVGLNDLDIKFITSYKGKHIEETMKAQFLVCE